MAGRGRGMTLPSWMTQGDAGSGAVAAPPTGPAPGRYPDARGARDDRYGSRDARQFEDAPVRQEKRSLDRRSSRDRSEKRSRRDKDRSDRDKRRSRSRSGGRKHRSRSRSHRRDSRRSDRSPSPDEAPKKYISKLKGRPSNFDVRPKDGIPLPPIVGLGTNIGGAPMNMNPAMAASLQQTRHARRLYVGGIPVGTTEAELTQFFNNLITRAMGPSGAASGPPVMQTYINNDKFFAFVELTTIELTTACCALDGISYKNATLRIRRPNDFRPEAVPANLPPPPHLDFSFLGIVSNAAYEGPNKLLVSGLPVHLSEEDIKELLGAFGTLKMFHLPRDAGMPINKGYAFCEYADETITNIALEGLNGMSIGDSTLNVKLNLGSGTSQQQSAPPVGRIPNPPSKVIILHNLVTVEELEDDAEFEDICLDIKEECGQYGSVKAVIIPRVKEGYPKSCEGSVFVEFGTEEEAKKASVALGGRKFAERTVVVDYFDELKFENRQLEY